MNQGDLPYNSDDDSEEFIIPDVDSDDEQMPQDDRIHVGPNAPLADVLANDEDVVVNVNAAEEANNYAPVRRYRRGIRAGAMELEAPGINPNDGVSWGMATHALHTSRLLTVDDPRAEAPAGFKGTLFAPQATMLAAMLAFERRPVLTVTDQRFGRDWRTTLQTNKGRINAAPSFGKTVLTLALVCAQKLPGRLPELAPLTVLPIMPSHVSDNRVGVDTAPGIGLMPQRGCINFMPEVTVRYSRFLPLTIVAAATNVITQWEKECARFTDKKYFTIEHVRSLREFETMYREGRAADLDMLFVKAGRVTTSFVVEGEPKREKGGKNRSLFEALARILEGVPVARLIIDDYDTLKLGNDDCFVPALFTWLISATRRQTNSRAILRTGHASVGEFFRANAVTEFPILGSALDDVLNKVCTLNCAPDYVAAHISSTTVSFRRIYVRGGQAARMMRDLEVPAEVIEMVNANAIGTAAQTLGLEARSIEDIIHRVLGSHRDKLRHAVTTLARIAAARVSLKAKKGAEKNSDRIKDLRVALKDEDDESVATHIEMMAGWSASVETSLASLEEWATGEQKKHSTMLNRMRDNIRERQCQCCTVPFSNDAADGEEPTAAYVLAGCCQIILCEHCVKRRDGGRASFITRCTMCAREIKLPNGLVRVGAEVDLEAALSDETLQPAPLQAPPQAPVAAVEAAATAPAPAEPNKVEEAAPAVIAAPVAPPQPVDQLDAFHDPKLKALVQFIRGVAAIDCLRNETVLPYVGGLLAGRRDVPWPAGKQTKILVFTMHGESTAMLHQRFNDLNIRHCILRGTRVQKDEAIRCLREDVHVMLVTAAKDCGGINLPFLSHIVFYHKVLDHNVETQVAARGQRLGRDHNFEVVTILNEEEATLV
jgi:hypothetical protein